MNVDLNGAGFSQRLRIIAVIAFHDDIGYARGLAQGFNRLVSLSPGRVLHLNLQHQMAAALEIETQADVV